MAQQNQNTGNNLQGPQTSQTRQTIADIKEVKKESGDFNDILKDSIANLKKISNLYDDIEARLNTMEKSSLNVKEINTQLFKAKQKDYTVSKNLFDAENKASSVTKNRVDQYLKSQNLIKSFEDKLLEARQKGDVIGIQAAEKNLNRALAINETKKLTLGVEESQLIALREEEAYTKAIVELAKQKLKQEKEVRRELGYSGAAMGLFAKKLGLGNDVYEQMVEKAKELKSQGKSIGFLDKLGILTKGIGTGIADAITDPLTAIPLAGAAISGTFNMAGNAIGKTGEFMAGLSEHSGNVVRGLTSGVSNLVKQIPFVGGLLGGLIDGFSAVLDLILGIDNAIVKSGRQLNMSAESARGLYRALGQVSRVSGDVYMTGIKYLESQVELTKELGITNQLSSEILRTNIQLKDFAGLEADTRAKITESSLITGKSAEATTKAVLSQVVGLRRATGISFQYQQILKEASSLGGYLGLQFAKYPEKLTKSILSTKALGLELKSLDSKASGFLDFESSITKEFEAQLILGKDINLNKIRQAYLDNDLETAAAEIAKLSGDAAGYTKLNRIEQDTLAGTLEMSRDEMAEMLKQQELYSKFGVKNREDLLKQVDLLRQSGKAQEAINKAGGEAAYNDLVRASAQEKLALLIEKIKQSIVEFVEKSGLIEKVEKFINYLTNPDTIKGIIGTIRDSISTFIEVVGEILADVVEVGGEIANFFTFGEKGDRREREAYELGAKIRAGSLEMSRNIKANENYGTPVTVQENVVKEKVASQNNTKNTEKQPEQKPAPYGPVPNPAFNLYASFTLDDGINKANIRYGKGSLNDVQSGKSGTIVVANTD